jgi:phosphoribosylformimino-5-aminoimidazole carboxamide ribotide isomerase
MVKVYPAIDLMNGEVVRLRRGSPSEVTKFNHLGSPIEVARMWESKGAELLHVVDLDGALGRGNNQSVIEQIVSDVAIPVQFGGGIRDEAKASHLLDMGVGRVILGTRAIQTPGIVLSLGATYGLNRVVVALDYKDDRIMSDGWKSSYSVNPLKLLTSFREKGVRHFLMTSVEMDGVMKGPDIGLITSSGKPLSDIIIAGGVASLEDIQSLSSMGFEAAVIGRALYEGALELPDAISAGRRYDS